MWITIAATACTVITLFAWWSMVVLTHGNTDTKEKFQLLGIAMAWPLVVLAFVYDVTIGLLIK